MSTRINLQNGCLKYKSKTAVYQILHKLVPMLDKTEKLGKLHNDEGHEGKTETYEVEPIGESYKLEHGSNRGYEQYECYEECRSESCKV